MFDFIDFKQNILTLSSTVSPWQDSLILMQIDNRESGVRISDNFTDMECFKPVNFQNESDLKII